MAQATQATAKLNLATEREEKMETTRKMELLKTGLDTAVGVGPEIRQLHLETNVFPYIQKFDPFYVSRLCAFFGIEISEYQTWKWLVQMPADHIKKIRRRVEDRLRKGTPWEILKVADILGVSTTTE